MNSRQIFAWAALMALGVYILQPVHNGIFGLLDNGPMLLLMLMGLDPNGWFGIKLAKYNLDPAYVACAVAMLVNTMTDGIAGAGDPGTSFVGVVVGCLVPIVFLPVIWRLRRESQDG